MSNINLKGKSKVSVILPTKCKFLFPLDSNICPAQKPDPHPTHLGVVFRRPHTFGKTVCFRKMYEMK